MPKGYQGNKAYLTCTTCKYHANIYIYLFVFSGVRLCTYESHRVESVQLPLIDGASIKPSETITFEVAKFELKVEYNTVLKPYKKTKKVWELDKLIRAQAHLRLKVC